MGAARQQCADLAVVPTVVTTFGTTTRRGLSAASSWDSCQAGGPRSNQPRRSRPKVASPMSRRQKQAQVELGLLLCVWQVMHRGIRIEVVR
jgi:hypothetical protein